MATINIDGQDYDLDKLSDDAKAQIASIQAVDIRLNQLKRDAAFVMTARNAYSQALKATLDQVKADKTLAKTEVVEAS